MAGDTGMLHDASRRSRLPGVSRVRRGEAGQSMVESALLFITVVSALVMFFSFMKASVAFRLKSGADAFGQGMLYDCTGAWPCRSR